MTEVPLVAGEAAGSRVRPLRLRIDPRVSDAASDADALAARVAQVARGGARAAVLGVSDGLVTNVCLILAVAGASASRSSVRLAGFASLIAGSLSMAAGEWVSVRSQVELFSGLIDELSSHLEAAGFGRETAHAASTELPLDEPRFLRFAAANLFGINPDELGSPMTAALTSLTYFAAGALVPLLPWFFTGAPTATWLSVVLTGLASVVVGSIVSRLSDRPVVWGALRQLAIVAGASAVTYGIGRLFGTAVS